MAELKVIQLWKKLKRNRENISRQNLGSIPLNEFDFLQKEEKEIAEDGSVTKQVYSFNGEEVLFIRYSKIFDDVILDGITYPNEFSGYIDDIIYLDTNEQESFSKIKQRKNFRLEPSYDLSGNVTGIASIQRNDFLKKQRENWAKRLNSTNPILFSLIKENYNHEYKSYLEEGNKTELAAKISNDSNLNVPETILTSLL